MYFVLKFSDWRGLATIAKLNINIMKKAASSPTIAVCNSWASKGATIGDLWDALEEMDRFDVIADTLLQICNALDLHLVN